MTINTATESDVDVLRDLNTQYIDSVVHSDVATFTKILSDDFLCTNPDGSVVDKLQFLKQTAIPVAFTTFDVHHLSMRLLRRAANTTRMVSRRMHDGTCDH